MQSTTQNMIQRRESGRDGVPLTTFYHATMTRRPSRPATLTIEVLPDGSPGTVIVKDPSDVPEFTITAVEFAKGLTYEPAQKNGSAVVGWLELEFYAGRLGS